MAQRLLHLCVLPGARRARGTRLARRVRNDFVFSPSVCGFSFRAIVSRSRYFSSEATEDNAADDPQDASDPDTEAREELLRDSAGADEDKSRETSEERSPIEVPAAWRDPGLWVDLELDRAGLLEGADPEKLELQSPWGSQEFPHPDSSVLFPHRTLNDHRSRPFVVPRGDKLPDAVAEELLESNRERLTTLWRLSNSHGISWDELDHAYVTFAKSGKRRYDEWARSQGNSEPLAATAKKRALERAKHRVARFVRVDPDNDDDKEYKSPEDKAVQYYPSRIKRVAARYYRKEKRQRLDPWRPGRLSSHLQQLVVARMLRRETAERALRFRPSST